MTEIVNFEAFSEHGSLLTLVSAKAAVFELGRVFDLLGYRLQVLSLICRAWVHFVALRCFQCPALAARDMMSTTGIVFVILGHVLVGHILSLLPVFLDNASEARVLLDREDGDLLRHRLELRVVLVHPRRVLPLEILLNKKPYLA